MWGAADFEDEVESQAEVEIDIAKRGLSEELIAHLVKTPHVLDAELVAVVKFVLGGYLLRGCPPCISRQQAGYPRRNSICPYPFVESRIHHRSDPICSRARLLDGA